jgi:hypothetical protein
MEMMFLICAIAGGTILVCQVLLTITGLSDEGAADLDDVATDVDDLSHDQGHEDSSWLFGLISFRTIVAALTFFGLAGMASLKSGTAPVSAVLLGVGAGFLAMLGVHRLMLLLSQLRADGTFKIRDAIGRSATVYVPIPANRSGAGQVQLRMDDRIVELKALTGSHERLATGTRVEVVEILGEDMIEVEPVVEAATDVT